MEFESEMYDHLPSVYRKSYLLSVVYYSSRVFSYKIKKVKIKGIRVIKIEIILSLASTSIGPMDILKTKMVCIPKFFKINI